MNKKKQLNPDHIHSKHTGTLYLMKGFSPPQVKAQRKKVFIVPFWLCILFIPLPAISAGNITPQLALLKGYDLEKALENNAVQRDEMLNMSAKATQGLSTGTLSKGLDVPMPTKNPNAQATGVIALVSLTMPDIALEQLLTQSAHYQIPLIIRGVLPSGFKPTVLRINQLLTKGGTRKAINSGFAINPEWFTQFNITQVPAFISIKAGRCAPKAPCSEQDFDVVYGNISMKDALDILAKGDAKENALAAITREEKR
jgi:conjugal transfer pilus assembly protein TrbC